MRYPQSFIFNTIKILLNEVNEAYQLRTSLLQVSDSLNGYDLETIAVQGSAILDSIYTKGFIEATSLGIVSDKNTLIA